MQNVLNVLKALGTKAYTAAPFAVGVAAGYFGHEPIKFVLTAVANGVKLLLKL